MTPFLTLALALSMPALSMAAAVTKPLVQTKPFGLDARQDETELPPPAGIVGGTTAAAGDFPFIVSLSKSNSHFCGGVLLNANTVVTAAHCSVGQTASSVKVRAGSLVSSCAPDLFSRQQREWPYFPLFPGRLLLAGDIYWLTHDTTRPGPPAVPKLASPPSSTTRRTTRLRSTTTLLSGTWPPPSPRAPPSATPPSRPRPPTLPRAPPSPSPAGKF